MNDEIERLVRNLHAAAFTEGRADTHYNSTQHQEKLNAATTQARHEVLKAVRTLTQSLECGQKDMDYLRGRLEAVEKDLSVIHPALEEAVRQKIAVESELRAAREELYSQTTFNAAFVEKLKEFGTIERLIESYSAAKMAVRIAEDYLERRGSIGAVATLKAMKAALTPGGTSGGESK